MPRFFIDDMVIGNVYSVVGEDALHISKSLRMREGETLTICSGNKTDYLCEITGMFGDTVELRVVSSKPNDTESAVRIHLFQCIPKGDKFDSIVQKAVELGAVSITPVLSSRCVSRPDKKGMDKKIVRYQKIAKHAAEQSGRGIIPEIRPLMSFDDAVRQSGTILLFYENATENLSELDVVTDRDINIFIGSEGGFSKEEVGLAKEYGAYILSLGKRILRTETAPIAALAALMYKFGEI